MFNSTALPPVRAVRGGWQIPPNTGKRYPAEILAPEEVRALLQACAGSAPTRMRNKALYVVLYRGGLRIGEALALRPQDVNTTQGTLHVMNGKGGKARTVGLDPEAMSVLERWLDKRAERGLNGRQPIFSTLKGRPMDTSYVRHALKRLAKRAGIERRVHAHIFRHSLAAELAAEGTPINVIQAQLGHANIATTSRYLDHISPTEVIAAMQSRPSWNAPN